MWYSLKTHLYIGAYLFFVTELFVLKRVVVLLRKKKATGFDFCTSYVTMEQKKLQNFENLHVKDQRKLNKSIIGVFNMKCVDLLSIYLICRLRRFMSSVDQTDYLTRYIEEHTFIAKYN